MAKRMVVTLGTLIEAAKKIKRPNLKQLRRNGEVPKGEMVELLAEAQGVPVDHIKSIGKDAMEVLSQPLPEEYFQSLRMSGSWTVDGINGIPVDVFCLALMNPNCPSSILEKSINWGTWRFIVRNPSLFLTMMGDPGIAWRIVEEATQDFGLVPAVYYRSSEKAVSWILKGGESDGKNRNMAHSYAVALEAACRRESEEDSAGDDRPGAIDPDLDVIVRDQGAIDDEEEYQAYLEKMRRKQPRYSYDNETVSSQWSQRATLADVQSSRRTWEERRRDRYEISSFRRKDVKDWPAHARVINLILPYFEEMNRLGLLR